MKSILTIALQGCSAVQQCCLLKFLSAVCYDYLPVYRFSLVPDFSCLPVPLTFCLSLGYPSLPVALTSAYPSLPFVLLAASPLSLRSVT